jgi:hypothetical protein
MTIKFPDLSHYKPDVPVAGLAALITKATQGTTMVDATYAGYRDAAHAEGIPFAGYHYVTTADPVAQARHAFSVIGHAIPAMWDFEDGSGYLDNLLAVHDAYTALGGRATLAYVPHWYWVKIGAPSLKPLVDRGLALISSQYTTYSDTGPGWNSYGGMAPDIWQFTSSATLAGHTNIDMNAFRGTAQELSKLFAGGDGAGSTEVDVALTKDDIDAIWTYKPGWPGLPVETPLGMLGDLRAVRDLYTTTLADLKAALAALPGAIAALPGAGPGGTLTEADVEQALGAVFARTSLTVAPPAAGSGS